ncbi:UDP-N-acetylmuramate dehydrogenase [Massilia sp. TS11]|uniref:UDP-N-acetylmuramate dehydrogenase n=1 Tax=Massilia sp. TS11 TaxID=2908003 RepID=UPI001EDB2D7D|nr:UDP-N-acetylmuramate dehydrogenase [Massilia sp. TS11]MCG2586191.1 UDP-N-acetylmuramate dehydrogenase [Massilia sp. TS11]
MIRRHASLASLNTFGIAASAEALAEIHCLDDLRAACADPAVADLPRVVLGGGSNVLLVRDTLPALVLHMAIRGRERLGQENGRELVRAGAGEVWHAFVQWTIAQGLGGLENLSLIPGTVGAAPIQNIGAYGAEIQDVFHSLRAYDPASDTVVTLDAAACRFGYRDSVFKHAEGRALIILDVCFALPCAWTPNLRYAELAQAVAGLSPLTPAAVSAAVVAIRQRKLPDPAVIGNAGSFFKNPVVTRAQCEDLLARFPTLVHHWQADGSAKLAAGWLIDQCGWKGRDLGRAGVYEKQALVLVNRGGASGREVLALAHVIQAEVLARFGVQLEAEPVFL